VGGGREGYLRGRGRSHGAEPYWLSSVQARPTTVRFLSHLLCFLLWSVVSTQWCTILCNVRTVWIDPRRFRTFRERFDGFHSALEVYMIGAIHVNQWAAH
jgi:hypothetical protein